MALELWIAFTTASIALLLIPGPTVMLVVSYALGNGRKSAWATVPGVTLGDFTAMTLSLLGAGAVLSTSATLFTILKLVGAAYLVWLGIQIWRTKPATNEIGYATKTVSAKRMFLSSFTVTALNPKGIIFFVAFVPQFIDPSVAIFQQLAILEGTFLSLVAINVTLWAVLVGAMRTRFSKPKTLTRMNKVGGCFLIGAGLVTAAVGQTK